MSELQNNKELVAVGHEFAKALGSDTPIIEIAKMMSRLDCTTAALRETVKQRDALTADNVARAEIIGQLVWQYSASGIKPVQKSLNPASALLFDALEVLRQPATAAAVYELKAQGVECAAVHIKQNIQHLPEDERIAYHDAVELCFGAAAQLRAGEANHG
ncbi:hypothetical protein VZ191_05535 [Enterobacter roggenkampii]|uniref:hypothetical protein n=1 Tax=Enterobacter roggenkampii TaxID=1812935 RepID=UPI002E2D487C|nr:hypothetical protein [Enterobacter roggenkampii]MED5757829.1 hypothetical protein [Enterobacter roggenkampii]